MLYSLTLFNGLASAYGSSTYDSSTYNGNATTGTATPGTTQSATPTPAGTSSAGTLANTGFDIVLIISLASAIIFAALVIRFVRRRPIAVPVEDDRSAE